MTNNSDEIQSKVYADGKITLPRKFREKHDIHDGDLVMMKVDWVVNLTDLAKVKARELEKKR